MNDAPARPFDGLPPELALLTVLDRVQLVAELGAEVDWPLVLGLADHHRLSGSLATALDRAGADAAPPAVAAAVHSQREARRERFEAEVLPQLEEVCAALAGAGIVPTVLKGAALVCTGRAGSGERPMADLDLLVRPDVRDAASRVMAGLGYEVRVPARTRTWARAHHYQDPAWYHPDRPLGVEIHWDLQERRHRLSFDPATLETVELVLPDGTRTRRLSDRDLLTHLGLHFWRDRADGLPGALGQLWDVRRVSPEAGDPLWADLRSAASRRGHAEVLAVVLACSHLLLGGPVPATFPEVARMARTEVTRSFAIRRVLAPRPPHVQLVTVTHDVEYRIVPQISRVLAQLRKPAPQLRATFGDLPRWRLRFEHTRSVGRLLLQLCRSPLESRAELQLDRWAHRLR